jgi:hypothetical protein
MFELPFSQAAVSIGRTKTCGTQSDLIPSMLTRSPVENSLECRRRQHSEEIDQRNEGWSG